MSKYFIRHMELNELKAFYERIVRDFAQGEYSPYAVIYQHLQNGSQKALIFCEGEQDLAYSVCTDNHDNSYVLISLLAVFTQYRGQGIGSAFIKRLHLMYKDKQALIVEVERPDEAKTQGEGNSRRRRIKFYEKAGFNLIEGVDYSIWGIPMHLMALPLVAPMETINQEIRRSMRELYLDLMGEELIHKMQISS
ncbi:MAG TPA: GNAT family N-acetyltransferase [Desulfosporosinus sp.]|nr:GNAT family N-acetyltransferase [Desulfosporosinus sp.]